MLVDPGRVEVELSIVWPLECQCGEIPAEDSTKVILNWFTWRMTTMCSRTHEQFSVVTECHKVCFGICCCMYQVKIYVELFA